MKTNTQAIQGILSIAAILCLVVGFFNLFTPTVNDLLYNKLFYILIGVSFFFQAPTLSNKNLLYPMYAAAALCIIGAFLPKESQFGMLKTIGLFAGVILSIFNRPRVTRQ
ncbi:hypothetical protein [Kaistella jeonii]|uniref:Uncharacterized protein n=1 Tax=Kaistella jeonii TaxID=266749 RepID=A0A0C1F872_9FLAO|nr:hypothetical protein [Kaistella jeonii]KIA89362.1 hypothetical protein OA86_07135 [Kaistella jeonii]SFC03728.1 hypothetical protein SAMN05421876_105152 [Kaistella jeonii]VEI96683.1 Uncharacterised protein [Kaistella jeonii]